MASPPVSLPLLGTRPEDDLIPLYAGDMEADLRLVSRCRLAEQRKRRTEKTLQEGGLGSAPGEDPKSEQNGQQVASQVVSGLRGGDRAALLSSSDAAAEERFELCQTLRHHLAEIWIVRRDFDR